MDGAILEVEGFGKGVTHYGIALQAGIGCVPYMDWDMPFVTSGDGEFRCFFFVLMYIYITVLTILLLQQSSYTFSGTQVLG